jgi:hypothetical protein
VRDDCLPTMEVYHLGKRLANWEIRNDRKWNLPTAFSKRDALIHHFAHKGIFATGRNHLDVSAGANLTGTQDFNISFGNGRDRGTDGVG